MNDTDITEFAFLMTGMSELYGKSISEAFTDFYWQALKPFEISAIRAALQRHVAHPKRGRYLPTIADITQLIEGDIDFSLLNAWTKVMDAIRHVGDWPSVVFDDPIIHKVLQDMGGWVRINQLTASQEPYARQEFETRYQGYMKMSLLHYPAQLSGRSEGVTAYQPAGGRQPIFLGNHQKAKHVFANGSSALMIEQRPLNGLLFQRTPEENERE